MQQTVANVAENLFECWQGGHKGLLPEKLQTIPLGNPPSADRGTTVINNPNIHFFHLPLDLPVSLGRFSR